MKPEVELSVSEFIAVLNQSLEFAYPSIVVIGELANFKVSKGRWVYFDLKDELASLRCFGSVYHLPGPLEDGMLLQVRGAPRVHNLYGFSFNIIRIKPVGEGALRKAANLLEAKLEAEGLFNLDRKRILPYPPERIGLITSLESAAYVDFIKVLDGRWRGVNIELIDVPVQGETAPELIIEAIRQFNRRANPPEVLVITRGGGSADDLWAFNTENLTREVAASRIPTLVAIGHEIDVSLAERAADRRASTPSNAAQILAPDREEAKAVLNIKQRQSIQYINAYFLAKHQQLELDSEILAKAVDDLLEKRKDTLLSNKDLLEALSPNSALKRGYAIMHFNNKLINSGREVKKGDAVGIRLSDAELQAIINSVKLSKE